MEFSMGKLPSSLVPSIARGLPILLVDHDITSLMCLASMLEQYSYKVTTTERATVALSMIQEQNDRFKLVMADINIPDMNSLQFLRLLITNNLPVILMSPETSLSVAYEALVDGACFLMQKPICFDDLKYVWQLAYNKKKGDDWRNETIKQECLKRMSTGKECEGININVAASTDNIRKKSKPDQVTSYQLSVNNGFKGNDKLGEVSGIIVVDNHVPRVNKANTNTGEVFAVEGQRNEESNMNEHYEEGSQERKVQSNSELPADTNKNKEIAEEEAEEGENNQNLNSFRGSAATGRKPRLVWTQELHLKFIAAISAFGDKHVGPKAILKMMNEPNLTSRQVASHLQKYKARMQRICPNSTNNSPPEVSNFSALTGSSHLLDNSRSVPSQLGHNSCNFSTGGKNGNPNLPQEVLPDSTDAIGLFYQNQQFPSLHQDLNVNQGFTYAISSQHQDQGFLNLHQNVLQQINVSPDSAVTGSQVHQNHFFMTSAEKKVKQDSFPVHFTSSNVPNTGYSLSDILTGIPEVEATPIMAAPPTFSEDQNQSLSQFAELLKVLEEEGEPEPHPADVDKYYDSLRDALLRDNEPPCYGW